VANHVVALDQPARTAGQADPNSTAAAQRAAFVVATAPPQSPLAEVRASDSILSSTAFQVIPTNARDISFRSGRDGSVVGILGPVHAIDIGVGQGAQPAGTLTSSNHASVPLSVMPDNTSAATNTPSAAQSVPLPEAAGLLTEGLSVGLAALERAVRLLTASQIEDDHAGVSFWQLVGMSVGLLAAASGYAAVSRRYARPVPALPGTWLRRGRGMRPEDLS
jgi:hypothetical protein